MTILIIIDGKIYRAKEGWITIFNNHFGIDDNVIACSFDEVGADLTHKIAEESLGNDAFTLDRLTGKEKP